MDINASNTSYATTKFCSIISIFAYFFFNYLNFCFYKFLLTSKSIKMADFNKFCHTVIFLSINNCTYLLSTFVFVYFIYIAYPSHKPHPTHHLPHYNHTPQPLTHLTIYIFNVDISRVHTEMIMAISAGVYLWVVSGL